MRKFTSVLLIYVVVSFGLFSIVKVSTATEAVCANMISIEDAILDDIKDYVNKGKTFSVQDILEDLKYIVSVDGFNYKKFSNGKIQLTKHIFIIKYGYRSDGAGIIVLEGYGVYDMVFKKLIQMYHLFDPQSIQYYSDGIGDTISTNYGVTVVRGKVYGGPCDFITIIQTPYLK